MSLIENKCTACEGGIPPLTHDQIQSLVPEIPGWRIENDLALSRVFTFHDFKEAVAFVNRVAALAEEEGHHPDITISYNRVTLRLTTHAINGLSENDFILAAKINAFL